MLGRSLLMKASGSSAGQLPWTPAQIATALWLDADAGNTLFDSDVGGSQSINGGAVGRWQDKSGNARTFTQSTSANRPTLITSSLNGKSIVYFDGSNDFMISAATIATIIPTLNATSWFAVANAETISTNHGIGAAYQNQAVLGDTQAYFALTLRSNTTNGYHLQANDTGERAATRPYSANSWAIFDGSIGGGLLRARLNGTTESTTAFGNIGRATGLLTLARQWNGGAPVANVRIAEVIIFSSYIAQSLRENIEGYLAHKWGLAANLPSGHPYKNAAPTVQL